MDRATVVDVVMRSAAPTRRAARRTTLPRWMTGSEPFEVLRRDIPLAHLYARGFRGGGPGHTVDE